MADERDPFDPEDPVDAVSEMFRRSILQLAIDAEKITIYRDLGQVEKLETFVAGALTGLVCVCFASVSDEGKDSIMEYLTKCLPDARLMADAINEPDGIRAVVVRPGERQDG